MACSDSTEPSGSVLFVERELDLGTEASGQVRILNSGSGPAGNIRVEVAPLKVAGGNASVSATVDPSELSALAAGGEATITVTVTPTAAVPSGPYVGRLRVITEAVDSIDVRLTLLDPEVTIAQADSTVRQGDVLDLTAVLTRNGAELADDPAWQVAVGDAGFVDAAGAFVGYTDSVRVVASAGSAADTVRFLVTPRGVAGTLSLDSLGHGPVVERHTSDLWVHPAGTHVYTGTWGALRDSVGNTLYVWDVTDPAAPVRTDSVRLEAGTINDVKVSPDGRWAVATHERISPNGISILDLSNPAHPLRVSHYTTGLESGVHNVWIEPIDGRLYVFACHDAGELKIINVSDPLDPFEVATFNGGPSSVHDVLVRDGLAFVSHWDVGLVILDVGHGIAGGSPENPREVSRVELPPEGNVHNAWYWPDRAVVFLGHELSGSVTQRTSSGLISVVDVADLQTPRRIATFRLDGAGPHNFWMDESAGILYSAYYNAGLLAIDASGRLRGELDRQGRRIAGTQPGGDGNTYVWAPQLVAPDLLWLSDMLTGLWSVTITPTQP